MDIALAWKQIFSAMVSFWQKVDEKGFSVLPILCGITVVCWLSGCVYLQGINENKLVENIKIKMELQGFCEESLTKTAKLIADGVIEADSLGSFADEKILLLSEGKKTCVVYAVKKESEIILLGEAQEADSFVRIYLYLILLPY